VEAGTRPLKTLERFLRFGDLAGGAIIGFTNDKLAAMVLDPRQIGSVEFRFLGALMDERKEAAGYNQKQHDSRHTKPNVVWR